MGDFMKTWCSLPLMFLAVAMATVAKAGDCEIQSSSPVTATATGDQVLITGTGMDKLCVVDFIDWRGGVYPALNSEAVGPTQRKVWVPLMPGGRAKIRSRLGHKGQGLTKGGLALDMVIPDRAPVLHAASPGLAQVADTVTLSGSAFFPPEHDLVVRFQIAEGRFVDARPTVLSANELTVVVPDPYVGLSNTELLNAAGYASTVSVFRATPSLMSNALPFRILVRASQPPSPPNPIKMALAPFYNSNAPNRSVFYTGRSSVVLPTPKRARITNIRNVSDHPMLSLKYSGGHLTGNALGGTAMNPGEVVSAPFAGLDANAYWEALSSESNPGSTTNPNLQFEITWEEKNQ